MVQNTYNPVWRQLWAYNLLQIIVGYKSTVSHYSHTCLNDTFVNRAFNIDIHLQTHNTYITYLQIFLEAYPRPHKKGTGYGTMLMHPYMYSNSLQPHPFLHSCFLPCKLL